MITIFGGQGNSKTFVPEDDDVIGGPAEDEDEDDDDGHLQGSGSSTIQHSGAGSTQTFAVLSF